MTRRNQDLMPSLIDDLMNWNNMLTNGSYMATPKMNVTESKTDYEVELCVPGLQKEDLTISLDNDDNLLIQMSKKEENQSEDKERHYLRHEFSACQFSQSLALPDNVKRDEISAKVENGVLKVTLPKFSEEEKRNATRLIEIC